jgi:hypothetical protein
MKGSWLASVAVTGAFIALSPSWAKASPEAAHEHYVRAIELVRQGELRAAKKEFERAYAESPHPSVLHNLARVCLDLGDLVEARAHAERFLTEAGPDTPEDQRQDVQRMLDELARRAEASSSEARKPSASADPPKQELEPTQVPQRSAPAVRASGAAAGCPACVTKIRVDALVTNERGRTAGIALGVTGAALLAVGAGVLVWNGAEARAAERGQRDLAGRAPSPDVADQQDLQEVLAYERAVSANQAAFRSVERFDVVGWSMVGVGAAMLGTGVVLVVTHRGEPETTLSLRGSGFALTTRF